jgi:hypothetical protein
MIRCKVALSDSNQRAVLVTGIELALYVSNRLKVYLDICANSPPSLATDNASSNDSCVDHVLKAISPDLPANQRKARRLRCLGHVVNLCARALLVGKESKKTLRKLDSLTEEESGSVWRDHGCVGKLHNIIKYIRWTPQRREQFAGIRIKGDLARFDELEVSFERRYITLEVVQDVSTP